MESQLFAITHSFLSRFGEAQRERLLALAEKASFNEGDIILTAGEQSRYFYLVVSGSVSIDVVARHYTARVQAIGPGDAFGWSSLLDGCDTLFQVRAREACTVLRLEGAAVIAVCREDAEFGVELLRAVLQVVVGRVLGAESKLAELCGVTAPIHVPGFPPKVTDSAIET
jgi:CRP-like cAMP-binding protein